MRAHRLLAVLGTGAILAAGCSASVVEFAAGECMTDEGLTGGEVGDVNKVDCTDPAAIYQVLAIVDAGDPASEAFPGSEAIGTLSQQCPVDTQFTLVPTQDTWEQADDDQIVCLGAPTATQST